jgi:RNA recognition motif-containing protein
VLHIRNLPNDVTEEELRELCEPFGTVIKTKLNVGNNKNQAFVQFGDVSCAMQMVGFYAGNTEPAKVGIGGPGPKHPEPAR